jgi:hypothetical protein
MILAALVLAALPLHAEVFPEPLCENLPVVAGAIFGVDVGAGEVPEVGVALADANRVAQLRGRSPEMMPSERNRR